MARNSTTNEYAATADVAGLGWFQRYGQLDHNLNRTLRSNETGISKNKPSLGILRTSAILQCENYVEVSNTQRALWVN